MPEEPMDFAKMTVPPAAEYVSALSAIPVTDKQRKMLRFHHSAPGHVVSATLLAHEAEFEDFTGANLQYGLLAAEILRRLGRDLGERVKVGILVDFVDPHFAANAEFLWVMRPQVVEALENLGWVQKTSHLLYPEEAVEQE
jgi:hypothetical protein